MGRARTVTAIIVASCLVVAADATATVRLNKGIGRVNLGMTSSQLIRTFGKPLGIRTGGLSPVARRFSTDRTYVEYEYFSKNGYTVGLARRSGKMRVVLVAVYISGQRTPQGIGVGSLAGDVRVKYPSVHCGLLDEVSQSCVLPSRAKAETVFVVDTLRSRVSAVAVRART